MQGVLCINIISHTSSNTKLHRRHNTFLFENDGIVTNFQTFVRVRTNRFYKVLTNVSMDPMHSKNFVGL